MQIRKLSPNCLEIIPSTGPAALTLAGCTLICICLRGDFRFSIFLPAFAMLFAILLWQIPRHLRKITIDRRDGTVSFAGNLIARINDIRDVHIDVTRSSEGSWFNVKLEVEDGRKVDLAKGMSSENAEAVAAAVTAYVGLQKQPVYREARKILRQQAPVAFATQFREGINVTGSPARYSRATSVSASIPCRCTPAPQSFQHNLPAPQCTRGTVVTPLTDSVLQNLMDGKYRRHRA